jgi:hypothetical protein
MSGSRPTRGRDRRPRRLRADLSRHIHPARASKVATPIPSLAGDVVLVQGQVDSNVLVLTGNDAPMTGAWSTFVLRLDVHSFEWTKQLLPLDAGKFNDGYTTPSERVFDATFIPGEGSAMCLGISRNPPMEPLR